MNAGLTLRSELLNATSCTMDVTITADYGDQLYTFSMACQFDAKGDLTFTVQEPNTISGITGKVTNSGGSLTFDDVALAFPLLADEQLSPVSAPWVMMQCMRSGFITSAGYVDDRLRLVIDDCYDEDALTAHIWSEDGSKPVMTEIYHNGRRILTLEVYDYRIK